MTKSRAIFLAIGIILLTGVVIYVASLYFDPIVNYYGVRMRTSQFDAFLYAHTPEDPDFALYCIAQPLTNLHEQSICFDSEIEFQQFNERRIEIERLLSN